MNDRYYGSDLNKLIHDNCRKDMTVNNIDLVMMRYDVSYADNRSVLRIIESKHQSEKAMSNTQKKVHIALANVFKMASNELIKYEHYVVRGSPPYETCKIINLLTGNIHYVGNSELIKFLNFEKELL